MIKNIHLKFEHENVRAICGILTENRYQLADDFLDWGFDGPSEMLCGRCANAMEKPHNITYAEACQKKRNRNKVEVKNIPLSRGPKFVVKVPQPKKK